MCKKEREDNQGRIGRRGFRNRHDGRIFVEPFDFFHVFWRPGFFQIISR